MAEELPIAHLNAETVPVPRQPITRYTVGLMVFVFGLFFAIIGAVLHIYSGHLKRQHYIDLHEKAKAERAKAEMVAPVQPGQ